MGCLQALEPVGEELPNNDYALTTGQGTGVWIEVESLAVWVKHEDDGVVVDVWPKDRLDAEPLATAYAFFSDGRAAMLDRKVEGED